MSGAIWMSINVTTRCNRDCTFCFNKKAGRKLADMSQDTVGRLLTCFEKHIEKYGHSEHTEVEIIGGEPLIVPEKTQFLATQFKKISPVSQVKVSSNTYLLDNIWLEWFKANDIVLCFSINDNSLGHIKEKLDLVKKYRVKLFPFFVLTPQNLNRLKELLVLFQGHQIFMIHEFGRTDNDYIDLFSKKVPEALEWALAEDLRINPERLYEAMSVHMPEGFNPTYGGLSFRVFVVEPDGRIGKYFYYDVTIGNIYDKDFDFIESIGKYSENLVCTYGYKTIKDCQHCKWSMICGGGGGCQMRKVDTLLEDSPPSLCLTHKRVIPLLLELKSRWKGKPFSYEY